MAGFYYGYKLKNLDNLILFSGRVQVILSAKLTQLMEQSIIFEAVTSYDLINFDNGRLRPDYLAEKFKLPMFGAVGLKVLANKILIDIISEAKNDPYGISMEQNLEIDFLFDVETDSYYCIFRGDPGVEIVFRSFPEVEEFYDPSNRFEGLSEAEREERGRVWSRILPELQDIISAPLTLTVPNGYTTLPRGFDTFDFSKLHIPTVEERLLLLAKEFLSGEFDMEVRVSQVGTFDFKKYDQYMASLENQARVISAFTPLMEPEITAKNFL